MTPRTSLIAIFLLALAMRLYGYHGIVGADDHFLSNDALVFLAHGPYLPETHYGFRVGLIYPLALVYAVFGLGEWQLALLPMAWSLGGVGLAYAIGRRLGDTATGLTAALLLACFPLDVAYGTLFFPDLPLGVTLAWAFYLLLGSREAPVRTAAAGVLWGYAWLIKVEAVFFGGVLLALLFGRLLTWRGMLLAMAVFAAVVAVENTVYYGETGVWGYRFQVIANKMGRNASKRLVERRDQQETAIARPLPVPKEPNWKRPERELYQQAQLWVFPKAWFLTVYSFGLHYYLLFAGGIWAVARGQRQWWPVVAWAGLYLFWLQFGGNPFASTFRFKSHLIRYCAMVDVPMAVLGGALLAQGVSRPRLRKGMLLAVVMAGIFFTIFDTLSREREVASKEAIRYAIRHDLFPLHLDNKSYALARFLLEAQGIERQVTPLQAFDWYFHWLDGGKAITELPGRSGYVLVNRAFTDFNFRRYTMSKVDVEAFAKRYPEVYRVDNPMGWAAYAEARLLVSMARLLPVPFLRDKITTTGEELLAGGDVIILRLPAQQDGDLVE